MGRIVLKRGFWFIAIAILLILIIIRYLRYEVPLILKYGLFLFAGLYLLSLFREWWKYR